MRKSNFEGKYHTMETKKKISEALMGHVPWNKGLKYTNKQKRNILKKSKIFHKGHATWNKGKKMGIDFRIRMSEINRGHTPWNKGLKLGPNPEHSQRMMGRIPWNKGKKCPQLSGGLHPAWKGGITKARVKFWFSEEYKQWRESVFARDNWTCQKTGIKGGILHAHHIKNFSEYPKLRLVVNNGVTFSEKAHKEFHKIYGTRNNTREQLEDFFRP